MFWENKDIVVGASSHLIYGFRTLVDTLKKKWDWEVSFFFRFWVKQPAPYPW